MATVWAARVGEQQEGVYSTGWSHTIKFDGLIDLNASLAQKRLQGKVTRLGVLAHGDAPGVVQLDRTQCTPPRCEISAPNWSDCAGFSSLTPK